MKTVSSAGVRQTLHGAVVHILDTDQGLEWNSRWHRKQRRTHAPALRSISFWLGLLFAIGSALFVAGGLATFADADGVAAWLNLVGSLIFTAGAGLAVIEALQANRRLDHAQGLAGLWSSAGGRASLIQIVSAAGFFQIAMIAGMFSQLEWEAEDLWLWTPSSIGSLGFVVASWIYWQEAKPANDIGTRSAVANLVGSACFLVGSLAGYLAQGPVIVPDNDFANPVFLLGSVLFLGGSILALAELRTPLDEGQTSGLEAC